MSATNAPPVFSLPLCLWSAIIQLLQLCTYANAFYTDFVPYLDSDVGTVTYVYSTILMVITMCSAAILLAVKSDVLAGLLHDVSYIKGVSPPPTHRWYCKTKTLVFFLNLVLLTCFSEYLCFFRLGTTTFIEAVFYASVSVIFPLNFWLPLEIFAAVLNLLACRLLVTTEGMAVTASTLFTPDGSFKCERDVEVVMAALRDLDVVIREVCIALLR